MKRRILSTAALTLIALGAFATAASAASFSITPGGAISAISLGLITYSSSAGRATCRLTLKGSLKTGLIAKTAGTEFGNITEGTSTSGGTRTCNAEGEYAPLVEPASAWRLNYSSILGTLPENVTGVSVNMEPYNFLQRAFSLECLYEAKPQPLLLGVTSVGGALYTTGLLRYITTRIAKHSGSVLCPAIELIGTFGLTPTQTIKRL